jgi:hypothetical protein
MGKGRGVLLPRARQEGVLTTDVGDEVVVYDQKEHRAHCLNRSAAIVWGHLDGRTSMQELVERLQEELDGSADEEVVWLALKELERADLLEGPVDMSASRAVSRRRALQRMGVAAGTGAILLPAISSIVAPPVHAQVSAVGCGTPEPNCGTFSCAGGCACAPTTERTNVCVVPTCTFIGCNSSAGCPPGMVCTTLTCCPAPVPFCVPIAPAGSSCIFGGNAGQGPWQHTTS